MPTIKLQYFKPSGKWGYEGEITWPENATMYNLIDHVICLKRENKLPGLLSGSWEGPIYIDTSAHPLGYPLLIPEK